MFDNIMAIELFVRDLARCTAYYRDTLGLQVRESEKHIQFGLVPDGKCILFPAGDVGCRTRWSVRSRLTSRWREVLVCCWLQAWRMWTPPTRPFRPGASGFCGPQRTSPGDYARRTLLTRKAISGSSTNRSIGSQCEFAQSSSSWEHSMRSKE